MKHIKSINELFGFGKKPDDDIVKDILNKVNNSVKFEFSEQHSPSGTLSQIRFTIDEFNICLTMNYEFSSGMPFSSSEYTYRISLDDTLLVVSNKLKKKLYDKCEKLYNDKIQSEKNNEGDYTKNDYRITNKLKK